MPAGAGQYIRRLGTCRHLPARWAGSPVSGRWAGGCPEPERPEPHECDSRILLSVPVKIAGAVTGYTQLSECSKCGQRRVIAS